MLGYVVLGEATRRVAGGDRHYREVMHAELFAPLGMDDTAIGVPDRLADRSAPVKAALTRRQRGDELRRRVRHAGRGSTMPWNDPVHDAVFAALSTGLMVGWASSLRYQRLSDRALAAFV